MVATGYVLYLPSSGSLNNNFCYKGIGVLVQIYLTWGDRVMFVYLREESKAFLDPKTQ